MGNSSKKRTTDLSQFMPKGTSDILDFVVNQQMKKCKKLMKIRIATINVGDVDSPYFCNFYPQCKQVPFNFNQLDDTLSKIRKSKYRFLVPEINSPQTSYLNQKIIRGRYSPFFSPYAGIHLDRMALMNREEFYIRWETEMEQHKYFYPQFFSKGQNFKKLDSALNDLKNYDFMCYHGILTYVYSILPLQSCQILHITQIQDNIVQILQENTASKYKQFQQDAFDIRIICKEYRARLMAQAIEKQGYDMIFLQEVDHEFLRYLQRFSKTYRISSIDNNEQLDTPKSAVLIKSQLTYLIGLGDKQRNFPLYQHNRMYVKYHTNEAIISKSDDNNSEKDQIQLHKEMSFSPRKKPRIGKLKPIQKNIKKTQIDQQSARRINDQNSKIQLNMKPAKSDEAQNQSQNKNLNQIVQIFGIPSIIKNKKGSAAEKTAGSWNIEPIHNQVQSFDPQILYSKRQSLITKTAGQLQYISQRKLSSQEIDSLNWNDNTIVQFFGQNILISSKLALGEKGLVDDLNRIQSSLRMLHKKYGTFHIIVGISIEKAFSSKSINPFLINQIFQKKSVFTVYPKLREQGSSQSFNQYVQEHRNLNQQIKDERINTLYNRFPSCHFTSESRKSENANLQDYLITNRTLEKGKIVNLRGFYLTNVDNYIPNIQHPFAHYIVGAQLQLQYFDKMQFARRLQLQREKQYLN